MAFGMMGIIGFLVWLYREVGGTQVLRRIPQVLRGALGQPPREQGLPRHTHTPSLPMQDPPLELDITDATRTTVGSTRTGPYRARRAGRGQRVHRWDESQQRFVMDDEARSDESGVRGGDY